MQGRLRVAATVVCAFTTSTLAITACLNTGEAFDEEYESSATLLPAEYHPEARRAAKRDVRALGAAIASFATSQDGGYPQDLDEVVAFAATRDLHSDSVVATYRLRRFSNGDHFRLCVEHAGLAHAHYYSRKEVVVATEGYCPGR